jgi:hypothetical protein
LKENTKQRVEELEHLVSTLRHGVNGALTPALLISDRLRADSDPRIQQAGERISKSIMQAVSLLKATREIVPPKRTV